MVEARIYRVVAPDFVAGLVAKRGVVTSSAPILKYMQGWQVKKVIEYAQKKGWQTSQQLEWQQEERNDL